MFKVLYQVKDKCFSAKMKFHVFQSFYEKYDYFFGTNFKILSIEVVNQ